MRFWDSSALIPLLVEESPREALLARLKEDGELLVWWTTPVECISALARREREGAIDPAAVGLAIERLRALSVAWSEVTPSVRLRSTAERLLRVHPLRAADALQLAAAIIGSEGDPATLELLTLDLRLGQAAEREGFRILPLRS